MRYSSVERGRSSRLHLPKGSSAAAAAAAVSPQLNLCYIYILRAPASIVVVNSESQLTAVFWPQFGYSQKISMHLLRNWWLLYAVMSVALPVRGMFDADEFDAADDADYDVENEQESNINPNLTSTPGSFQVKLGDTVRLPCEIDQTANGIVFVWSHNSDLISFNGKIMVRPFNFKFQISSSQL